MTLTFTKATKKRSKARVAIDGPSGSGKTYTSLIAATVLAQGGKIAVIDTERGSASLYSDKFNFDVLELVDTFSLQLYIDAIMAAEDAGYSVIVIDSLSHAWEGEGGALDMVDRAAKRSQSGNSYMAWKDVTPLQRKLVDTMLKSKSHIIATMRSKMDYVQEKDERTGKTTIRKVGMAPIQRQGMEYEFTIVADMDIDHNLMVSKSRCEVMADAVVNKPNEKFFETLLNWLNDGEPITEKIIDDEKQKRPVSEAINDLFGEPVPVLDQPILEPVMTLETAMAVKNSEGAEYGDIDSSRLTHMISGINLGLKKPDLTPEKREEYLFKRAAIQVILRSRNEASHEKI